MKPLGFLCFLAFSLLSFESSAQQRERHFGFCYWMLGVYGGTENFETIDFGINFPVYNQNTPGVIFPRHSKDTTVSLTSFSASRSFVSSPRYWIPEPLPKRISLQLGVERNFSSLVYRPEIGLVFTPISFLGLNPYWIKDPAKTKRRLLLNHTLISGEFLPSIREFKASYRIGAGYMIRVMRPIRFVVLHNNVRFYLLYHYNFSKDWSGHLFTLQIHYNREPFHYKFNPAENGYKYF